MRKIVVVLLALLNFVSCSMQKKMDIDYGIYMDCIKLEKYDVVDTLAIDSIIEISMREHKKITGYTASFFCISELKKAEIEVRCCSTYDYFSQGKEIEWTYVFSYYKDRILLIYKNNIPSKLFKKTGEDAYVMLMSGGSDLTNCVFDSTYHFIKSESAIVEVR